MTFSLPSPKPRRSRKCEWHAKMFRSVPGGQQAGGLCSCMTMKIFLCTFHPSMWAKLDPKCGGANQRQAGGGENLGCTSHRGRWALLLPLPGHGSQLTLQLGSIEMEALEDSKESKSPFEISCRRMTSSEQVLPASSRCLLRPLTKVSAVESASAFLLSALLLLWHSATLRMVTVLLVSHPLSQKSDDRTFCKPFPITQLLQILSSS